MGSAREALVRAAMQSGDLSVLDEPSEAPPTRRTRAIFRRQTLPRGTSLPSFSLGHRPTKVVAVGSAFAAIFDDTGEVVGSATHRDLADAIEQAMRAAKCDFEADADDTGF